MPTFAIDELDTEQEPQITAHGFFASPLTDNIQEKPDGSLLVENCPIARTGFQSYSIRDLPQQAARKLGLDLSNPSANIDLYRPASEVFAPAFIASLEGASICDNHPPDFITPETFSKYSQGHMQNVRKGDEQLDDGEWPLLADLVISGEPLVGKVRRKEARENSLGYDFSIRREGNKIIQCEMVGNHDAVVPKGRAGDDVRINDAAPEIVPPRAESPPAQKSLPTTSTAAPVTRASTDNATSTKKERKPVKNNILHLLGLGLRAKAADAETDPEELAQAALDVGEFQKKPPEVDAEDKRGRDRKAKDEAEYEETEGRDRKVRDRKKSRDEATIDPIDEDHESAEDEHRSIMHDALDRMIDAQDRKGGRDRRADDTDLEELKNLLGEFFTEEETEPAHEAADADPAELEEALGAGEEPDAEDAIDPGEEVESSGEEALAEDEEEDLEAEDEDLEEEPIADRKKARDQARARAQDSARATLNMLRPFVAKLGKSKAEDAMKKAYNTALGTLRASRVSTGGYGEFARGAHALDHKRVGTAPPHLRARAADSAEDSNAKLQKLYDDLRTKGGK